MAYKINKTDGSLLVEIVDSTIDQTATDLTLIGKNVSGFGEYINENFVKLLENFASTSEPNNPITGQIWFDIGQNRLKVYDGANFKQGSGPLVSGTAPVSPVQGDLWIDSAENQLYFYDGTDRELAGPIYKASQGLSGFEVATILDTNNAEKVIVKLYVGEVLLGIFSKTTTAFTPKDTIPGFSGTIKPGFTAGTLSNLKFNVTASAADALNDGLGNTLTSNSFVRTDTNTTISSRLTIQNVQPLVLGPGQNYEVNATSTSFQITSNVSGQDYAIRVKNGSGVKEAITVKSITERVGIFNSSPSYSLDVTGDLRVTGDLLVEGATTTINTTTLAIEDKNVILANVGSPTNVTAEGGGITVKGTSDKTFAWTGSYSGSWESSEHVNLVSGKALKIDGTTVVAKTASDLQLAVGSSLNIVMGGPAVIKNYTLAQLSVLSPGVGAIAYCTDLSVNAGLVYYTGSAWRRVSDDTVAS